MKLYSSMATRVHRVSLQQSGIFFLCGCVYGICPFGVMDINRTALVMGIEDQYVLCDIIIVSVMGKCIWREGEVRF